MPPLPTTNLEKEKTMTKIAMNSGAATVFLTLALTMTNAPLSAQEQTGTMPMDMPMMSTGLVLPRMDPVQGRALFASKGCVVCHSINGVGGTDAPMLDAEFMDLPMNPFEFAASLEVRSS
jgi:cytochrome c